MANENNKGLLIAILAVAAANLLATTVQIGLLLRPAAQNPGAAAQEALPSRYTAEVLAGLASRVTGPYNRGDVDSLYAVLDDYAKRQITRGKFQDQLGGLKDLVGNVDSADYTGFQRIPSDGGVKLYKLSYTVSLSGAKLHSGVMNLTVIDRPAQPGVVGFFITGSL